VTVDIKFCGLTRREDAAHAVSLGASFTGVIFAGGPRLLTAARAAEVLADVPDSVHRVGVFARQSALVIAETAEIAGLRVAQLHDVRSAAEIRAVRAMFAGAVWPVLRVAGGQVPEYAIELLAEGDALVLDAYVPGMLGGTGVALPWDELSDGLAPIRGDHPIVLAGGLRPENVARALAAIEPAIADVASGVEQSPGIKDHDRMRAFRDAVAAASIHS